MNDKEMLELAAKAAGLEIISMCSRGARLKTNSGMDVIWNPRTDDGDALRLAVKLEIRISFGEKVAIASFQDSVGEWIAFCEDFQLDVFTVGSPYASTRLAIVRAAAEIGKAMP